jgi:hypothetical protein
VLENRKHRLQASGTLDVPGTGVVIEAVRVSENKSRYGYLDLETTKPGTRTSAVQGFAKPVVAHPVTASTVSKLREVRRSRPLLLLQRRAALVSLHGVVEMFETIINLKPEDQWRPGVTIDSLTAEMNKALEFPGVSTMSLPRSSLGFRRYDRNAARGRVLEAGYMPGPKPWTFIYQGQARSNDGELVRTFIGFPRLPALFDEQDNDC